MIQPSSVLFQGCSPVELQWSSGRGLCCIFSCKMMNSLKEDCNWTVFFLSPSPVLSFRNYVVTSQLFSSVGRADHRML